MGSFFQCEQYIEGALHTVSQSPKMWLNSPGLWFWENGQHTVSDATPCVCKSRTTSSTNDTPEGQVRRSKGKTQETGVTDSMREGAAGLDFFFSFQS